MLLLMLLIANSAVAQSALEGDQPSRWKAGSLYSYFGLGMSNTFYSSQAGGMGLDGVALFGAASSTTANPALWGYPVFSTGMGNFYVMNFDASDPTGDANYTSAGVGTLQFLFPMERNRLGFSASLQPYTTVSYRLLTTNVMPAGTYEPNRDVVYATEQSGLGGLNKLEFGVGFSLNKNISVGVAPALAFGIIDRSSEVAFDTIAYQSVKFRNREIMRGFAGRMGLFANQSNFFREGDNVAFGLTYDLPIKIGVKERLYTTYLSDEVELPTRSSESTTIPWKATAGLAYRPAGPVLVSAEASYQPWSNYTDVGSIDDVEYQNQLKLGLGGEISPTGRRSERFLRNFIYRGGLSYDSGNLKFVEESISTWLVHVGFGIPSRYTGSSIDVNFSYGVRGSGTTDFVTEKIFMTRLSFNLTEAMFLKRKIQ